MSVFVKKNWNTGETITESDMDRLENGVQEAFTTAAAVDIIISDHVLDTDLHLTVADRTALNGISGETVALLSDVTKTQVGLSNVENILNNYSAVTDPLATSNGYNIGSIWVNTSTDKSYICVDNTNNAAVWRDITASGSTVSGSGVTNHNDLSAIQGGAAGNYYHLTAAQSSALISHLTDYNNPHQTSTGATGYVTLDALGYLEREQIPKSNIRNVFNGAFTSHNAAASSYWRGLAWSPELRIWACVSSATSGTDKVMTSTDGKTWTLRTSANANQWADVCWSPELKKFVAVGYGSAAPTAKAMTSPDGITWTAHTTPNSNWTGVCWSPEKSLFVAVSNDYNSTSTVMTSPDGETWTARTAAHALYWEDVVWAPELNGGNGYFVAVGGVPHATSRAMYSADGITWTGVATPGGSNNQWGGVTWSPELGMLAAVSYTGTGTQRIMTSANGTSWSMRDAPNSNALYKIIWSPEMHHFVASAISGIGNRITYSRDGVTWYAGISARDESWYTIGYSTTLAQIVCTATGPSSYVMVSPDVMDYAIDGDYAKVGQFNELYIDTYPVLSTKEDVKSITTAYTATVNDRVLLCNGTFTVTLPLAARANGITYVIKNVGTGTITIDGYSSETIDGATTKALSSQYASHRIVSNGTAWFII